MHRTFLALTVLADATLIISIVSLTAIYGLPKEDGGRLLIDLAVIAPLFSIVSIAMLYFKKKKAEPPRPVAAK